jgi:hypothetical protein
VETGFVTVTCLQGSHVRETKEEAQMREASTSDRLLRATLFDDFLPKLL